MQTPQLELRRAVVGPWSLNAYALVCPATGQSLLVDPGAEPESLQQLLAGTIPQGIVVTHGHPDHIGALEDMRRRLRVAVMGHPEAMGFSVEFALQDDARLSIGDHRLRIYHAPGHTRDQICLGIEDDPRFIVGDTIFEGGPGRTWSVEDFGTTLQTLRRVVLAWTDAAVCYPGHGPSFCLGDKRKAIEAFVHGAPRDFCGDAVWEMATRR